MTSSAAAPQPTSSATPRARSRLATRLTAFTPLWVLLIASLAANTFLEGMLITPPTVFGIPAGIVFEAAALVWMLLGVALVWSAGSKMAEMFALLVFTVPATVVVVFTPAVVTIMHHLG